MRVIRTEIFFDNVSHIGGGARRSARDNPGIGVAFFGGRVLDDFLSSMLLPDPQMVPKHDLRTVEKFLDLSLRGVESSLRYTYSKYLLEPIRNPEQVRLLLNAEIVVEESPPHWEIFKALVSKSPSIAIGTYAGMELAGSMPQLMVLTIPFGIIAVSSAVGISKALEAGLNKKVARVLGQRRQRQ
ncbi:MULTISPECIES: hypothetical protein [unclassified Bradyrhizobium]|uniref:hypothetical protein n=1 Tax=unclassified Bradyrhizobium TaxID=2631580 RepID=UPI0028E84DC6|nr:MULTISPECIES: hypothetical protein [unclassified Bradyrhizobium]